MLETNQLQALVAVAQTKSFSKAAEELHVTQSAISQNIKALETKVGVGLLKRSGKSVVLTSEGERLYQVAKDFFHRLDDALHDIDVSTHDVKGRIRLGTVSGIGKSWLASRMIDLATQHPDLRLTLVLDNPDQLLERFKQMKVDAIVVPQYSMTTVGERLYLGPEKSTLVYPKQGPWKIDDDLKLEELIQMPIILFEEDDYLFNLWCRLKFGQVPRKIKRRFVVNGHGMMLQAVSKGLGVAVVPTHVLHRSYYHQKLGTVGTAFEIHSDDFYLVYHQELKSLERMKVVIEAFEQLKTEMETTNKKDDVSPNKFEIENAEKMVVKK